MSTSPLTTLKLPCHSLVCQGPSPFSSRYLDVQFVSLSSPVTFETQWCALFLLRGTDLKNILNLSQNFINKYFLFTQNTLQKKVHFESESDKRDIMMTCPWRQRGAATWWCDVPLRRRGIVAHYTYMPWLWLTTSTSWTCLLMFCITSLNTSMRRIPSPWLALAMCSTMLSFQLHEAFDVMGSRISVWSSHSSNVYTASDASTLITLTITCSVEFVGAFATHLPYTASKSADVSISKPCVIFPSFPMFGNCIWLPRQTFQRCKLLRGWFLWRFWLFPSPGIPSMTTCFFNYGRNLACSILFETSVNILLFFQVSFCHR